MRINFEFNHFDDFCQIDFDKLSRAKLDFTSFKTKNIETPS